MSKLKTIRVSMISMLVISVLPVQSAFAQEPQVTPTADTSQWGLGIAASSVLKPYRDIETDNLIAPVVFFENKWVSLSGPGVDIKAATIGPVSLRIRGKYGINEGYDSSDSDFLRGMEDRKAGIWLGGAAVWKNEFANLNVDWLSDVSGNSHGQKFSIGVDHRFKVGYFDFTPRLVTTVLNRKYVSYYYGVERNEVLPDRAYYEGDSTANIELGLRMGYSFKVKQSVFLDVSATALGSSIKDSPIVDRSTQTGIRFGYLYRF